MSLIIRVILLYVIGWSDRAIEKGPSGRSDEGPCEFTVMVVADGSGRGGGWSR